MIIIDDVIDTEYQEKIKSLLLGKSFPWFYLQDVTNGKIKSTQKRPAFSHTFVKDGEPNSPYYTELLPLVKIACEKAKISVTNIFRIKTFLQLPLAEKILDNDLLDTVHVDITQDHWVMIYYPFDCDGHTVLLDTEYTEELGQYPQFQDVKKKIVEKVKPKQGRAVFFNGNRYHTAEQPREGFRCIINFDLL